MPAILAHWVVAKEVAWRFINAKKDGHGFFQGIQNDQYEKISRYLYLGANGPDLCYFYNVLQFWKAGKNKWADILHYNKQGEFILQLVLVAKNTQDRDQQLRTMAYALGHTTHLMADAVVHPYVNCFAGVYSDQTIPAIHRTVELHQDSWLAQKYFGRKTIDEGITEGYSWKRFLPFYYQTEFLTQINNETINVLADIDTAIKNTHGYSPGFPYLINAYENLYFLIIDEEYDKAALYVPQTPQMELVQHSKLKSRIDYYNLLTKQAVTAAEIACEAVIALYRSNCSDKDLNLFRSKVKNLNMDNGYWIDVKLERNKLKIIFRHIWCK